MFEREFQKICEEGITLYFNEFERCLYKFPGGASCIARPETLHNHHISPTRQTAPGSFLHDKAWSQDEGKLWISEIHKRFLQYEVAVPRRSDIYRPQRGYLLRPHRKALHNQYHDKWVSIRCNKTCLSCLQAVPHYVLGCGHSYCALCIQEHGNTTSDFEGICVMSSCILCGADNHGTPRTKP
jgi:hypothetical protein